MMYLKILLPNQKILTLGYVLENRIIIFDKDIEINGWVVSKVIQSGGPESRYEYDFKNYLEFVITDKNGISRIEQYYYNKEAYDVSRRCGSTIEMVPHYIQSSSIFMCMDWADYDLYVIKKVLMDDSIDESEQLKQVKKIINIM